MKTEWWYDDASFHYSGGTELYLARLTVRDNGTARLLLASGEVLELESEEQASLWLGSEEYRRLGDLLADLVEDGIAPTRASGPPPARRRRNSCPRWKSAWGR